MEYLLSEDGGGAKRFFLLGTDYVYPRTTNKILRAFLHAKGIRDKDIEEVYTPFGYSDYQTIVANIKIRRRWQNGSGLHHQWRFQRTVLQRAG
nr:urea ABC transporter, urea binding protein [Klebsiella pneumoniae]